MVRELHFQPTRTHQAVHGMLGCKHGMTPNVASSWACPRFSPTQSLNEFGCRMHVVSCSAYILVFFHKETPRKSIECLKLTKLGMHAVHGNANVRKILGAFGGAKKKVRDLPFRPTQTYKVVHGVFRLQAWYDTKFCQRLGMPKFVRHAKFEQIRTPNKHCVSSGLCFRVFLTGKT